MSSIDLIVERNVSIPLGPSDAADVRGRRVREDPDLSVLLGVRVQVLGGGCVQEEIRFVVNPECLVSLLVCEAMKSREAIFVVGAERFSSYTGYGHKFRCVDS